MSANNQVINDDKTHVMIMGTKGTAARREEVTMQAGPHLIRPTRTEKLLGVQLSDNLKFRDHIIDSNNSKIRQLTYSISWLKLVSIRQILRHN